MTDLRRYQRTAVAETEAALAAGEKVILVARPAPARR
jgi:hypothetical protein